MALNNFQIKERIDYLYSQLRKSAATFIYKPDEISKINKEIARLQSECSHVYENNRCIYCGKSEENAD